MAISLQKVLTLILVAVALMALYGLTIHSTSNLVPSDTSYTRQKGRRLNAGMNDNKENNVEKKSIFLRKPDKKVLNSLSRQERNVEHVTDPSGDSPICDSRVFLIIVVASSPGNFARRSAIRGSWGSTYYTHRHTLKKKLPFKGKSYEPQDVVRTVFLMGASPDENLRELVSTESHVFGDIVHSSFKEDYRNLTLKTRLGLKWAYYSCKSDFVIKTDDDVFVNVVPLVEWLKQGPQRSLYTGWCNFGSPVVRDKGSKWYVSEEDFSGSEYPGYCLGGGYLMSEDVLHRVMVKSYGRKLFPMEDLYVGLMIAEFGDVRARDEKKHFDLIFGGRRRCEMPSLFLAHPVNFDNQLALLVKYEYEERSCG